MNNPPIILWAPESALSQSPHNEVKQILLSENIKSPTPQKEILGCNIKFHQYVVKIIRHIYPLNLKAFKPIKLGNSEGLFCVNGGEEVGREKAAKI